MANFRNRHMDDPANASSRVFVGNIPTETDREVLKKKFEAHGPVSAVMVLKGFAFIQYEKDVHAKIAIERENGVLFNGKKLDVKPSKSNNNMKGGGGFQHNQQEQHNTGQGDRGGRGGRGGGHDPGPGWGRGLARGGHGGRGGSRGGYNNSGGNDWGSDGQYGYDDNQDYSDGNNYNEYDNEYDEMSEMERYNDRLQADNDSLMYGGGRGGQFGNMRGHTRGGNNFRGRGGGGWGHGDMSLPPPAPPGLPPDVQEKPNDVEIICMDKQLRVYGENIEDRLKNMGLCVDILFPNPDIALAKVLGNIASRGVMYAICLTGDNRDHQSLTLNVLQGQQQEHRNMPVDDAMSFISKNFPSQVGGGNTSGSGNSVISKTQSGGPSGHPHDIQKIINFLSDDRPLSIMEFDKMIKYLVSKRTETLREEYGENIPGHLQHPPVGPNQDPATKAKQEELQNRIQKMLKEKKSNSTNNRQNMTPSLQAAIDSLVKNGPNLLSNMSQGSSSSGFNYSASSSQQFSSSRNQGFMSGTGGFGGGFGDY